MKIESPIPKAYKIKKSVDPVIERNSENQSIATTIVKRAIKAPK